MVDPIHRSQNAMQRVIRILATLLGVASIVLLAYPWWRRPSPQPPTPEEEQVAAKLEVGGSSYPIKYRIGSVDERFNIGRESFLQLAREAESLWESPFDLALFEYGSGALFKVNLVFDERQEKTIEAMRFKRRIEVGNKSYNNMVQEYEHESELIKELQEKYDTEVASFNNRMQTYNTKIEYWNSKGGAPQEEYSRLTQEKYELNSGQRLLEGERLELNERIKNHNDLAGMIDHLAKMHSLDIELFNGKFVEPREFEKGVFNRREINIYQFNEEKDLRLAIAHEFGHALGFMHTDDPQSVMFRTLAKQDMDHLHLTPADLELLGRIAKNLEEGALGGRVPR